MAARNDDSAKVASSERSKCAQLYRILEGLPTTTWPVVYSADYNMSYQQVQHTFDSEKYGKIFSCLQEDGMLDLKTVVQPVGITREQLLEFHTQRYLDSLKDPTQVAAVIEMAVIAALDIEVIEQVLLSKLRLQTGGTIMAGKLALDRGWSIHLGGGFHHCSSDSGGGFCAYADISGALKTLHSQQLIRKALIIDLDAHQGNGHEEDFCNCDWVSILDVYNKNIYPMDRTNLVARMRNLTTVQLDNNTKDDNYLQRVSSSLDDALQSLGPEDIVLYNAGTDCIQGDPLGHLDITPEGIVRRDELVFRKVRAKKAPIVMVLSGGYKTGTAKVIAQSILNLKNQKLITL